SEGLASRSPRSLMILSLARKIRCRNARGLSTDSLVCLANERLLRFHREGLADQLLPAFLLLVGEQGNALFDCAFAHLLDLFCRLLKGILCARTKEVPGFLGDVLSDYLQFVFLLLCQPQGLFDLGV